MVAFTELSGSPTFTIAPNGSTATRMGRIEWSDIDAFIDQVFPPTIISGTTVVQRAGHQFPGKTYLYARNLRIEPSSEKVDGPDVTPDFDTVVTYTNPAKATIEYSTPEAPQSDSENNNQNNQDPVPFLTHQWTLGGEFMTIPNTGFIWELDGESLGEDIDIGLFVPTIEHSITWPRVTKPPFAKMRTTIGRINSDVLNFSTGTIAAETCLFLGAELKRDIMSDGTRAWSVTYRFSERIVEAEDNDTETSTTKTVGGWNHFYRSDSAIKPNPGFYPVVRDDISGEGPYPTTTFAELFISG